MSLDNRTDELGYAGAVACRVHRGLLARGHHRFNLARGIDHAVA
jgi:hypothetical protein